MVFIKGGHYGAELYTWISSIYMKIEVQIELE